MFSFDFGAVRETSSRAFVDLDDDEDFEEIPEKTFTNSFDMKHVTPSTIILTTTRMAEAFVHTHLSLNENSATLGKISTSSGDQIATYTEVSENIVNCNVNEHLLTPNDFNNFATAFCDAVPLETKIIILHSKTEPLASQFEDRSIIRCLKSKAWSNGNIGLPLEQPNVLGGVSAAVLTLSELKNHEAFLICCFSPVPDIDSMSLNGYRQFIPNVGIKELSLLDQHVIQSRLKGLYNKPSSNLLYI